MSDFLFLAPEAPLTLGVIMALSGASFAGAETTERLFYDVAALDGAGPRAVTLALDTDPSELVSRAEAGACFIAPSRASLLPTTTIALVTETPAAAFAAIVAAFYPGAARPASMFANRGISPAAFIHAEARLEADVTIDPGVVIGPKAEIGSGTVIGANSVIGPRVRVGRDCAIGAQVTISHAFIGNGVLIAPGARIGQNGPISSGAIASGSAIAGLGRVIIQDGVEIGANTTIDRGGLGDTILGEGCRIGNLAHVARDRLIPRYAVVSPNGEAVAQPL